MINVIVRLKDIHDENRDIQYPIKGKEVKGKEVLGNSWIHPVMLGKFYDECSVKVIRALVDENKNEDHSQFKKIGELANVIISSFGHEGSEKKVFPTLMDVIVNSPDECKKNRLLNFKLWYETHYVSGKIPDYYQLILFLSALFGCSGKFVMKYFSRMKKSDLDLTRKEVNDFVKLRRESFDSMFKKWKGSMKGESRDVMRGLNDSSAEQKFWNLLKTRKPDVFEFLSLFGIRTKQESIIRDSNEECTETPTARVLDEEDIRFIESAHEKRNNYRKFKEVDLLGGKAKHLCRVKGCGYRRIGHSNHLGFCNRHNSNRWNFKSRIDDMLDAVGGCREGEYMIDEELEELYDTNYPAIVASERIIEHLRGKYGKENIDSPELVMFLEFARKWKDMVAIYKEYYNPDEGEGRWLNMLSYIYRFPVALLQDFGNFLLSALNFVYLGSDVMIQSLDLLDRRFVQLMYGGDLEGLFGFLARIIRNAVLMGGAGAVGGGFGGGLIGLGVGGIALAVLGTTVAAPIVLPVVIGGAAVGGVVGLVSGAKEGWSHRPERPNQRYPAPPENN